MGLVKRLIARAFFSDVSPIIETGSKRSLEAADMPVLPDFLQPDQISVDESRVDYSSGIKMIQSLMMATRAYWQWPLAIYMIFALCNLLGPVLVNQFVKQVQIGFGTREDLWRGLLFGLGVGLTGLVGGLSIQHYILKSLQRFQIFINVVNKKIFAHALSLTKESREKIPVGDIVNHLSTDSDSVAEVGSALADLVYTAVVIVGAIGLLFYYLGSTAVVAVILLSVLAPITKKVSRDFTHFDEVLMKHRDRRVTLMSQILNAIRVVKYFVWEDSVSGEVEKIRVEELSARRRIARAELLVTVLYIAVGTFVLFAVLGIYVWRGGVLDPALVFTCISLFSLLEDPFAMISRVISVLINAKVGASRITNFLAQPVLPQRRRHEDLELAPVALRMEHVSVELENGARTLLEDVTLRLGAGQSLAVVGPVGAGKSTFIHALLGEAVLSQGRIEYEDQDGFIHARCRISYVPQEAYILNGTLKENLSFGRKDVSDEEVRRALYLSSLWHDIEAMPGGIHTEIGEKGINLSGGQRQRLSLARAVLHCPQLVVLDDPLSAVDQVTEQRLCEDLLFGHWQACTRIMITHRLTHLKRFDRIAFLQNGRLVAFGTYDELYVQCEPFRSYVEEYAQTHTVAAQETQKEVTEVLSQKEPSRITEDEDRQFGAVHGRVYWDYVLSLCGQRKGLRPVHLVLLILAAGSGTALPLMQKAWLGYVSNIQSGATQSSWAWLQGLALSPLNSIYAYGLLGLVVLSGTLCSDLYWLKRGLAAGRDIHAGMMKSVLGATLRFFDSTPIGRVLQRFARDMESIDIQLQWSFEHSMKCFAQVIITLVMIVAVMPFVLVFFVPVLWIYYRIQKMYRSSAREAKRLDSISRSPRYAHFKETLQGLVVIRAFGKQDWFMKEFYKRLSHHQRMFHGHYMINRWFSSRIPVVGAGVATVTVLGIMLSVYMGSLSPGLAGLLTVYSLSFWGVLNWGIRIWSEVEARMTSMERVKFYSRLPQERKTLAPVVPPESWPSRGEVIFENVQARYAEHLPLVLKGLNCQVRGGSKVGIIGRTGSGKSTMFQTLYRFVELESGRILIDGVDIATLELARLRRALAIIPQDPTLFMGTIRSNLDRYNEYEEARIWEVLERTSLSSFIRSLPKGLETELVENGANLSQGQRQLLCLARALLMEAKIVVLDEATASVDVKTDALVQKVIRENCKDVTMLIIAHRLGTVRDCEQILEIHQGQVRRQISGRAREERAHSSTTELQVNQSLDDSRHPRQIVNLVTAESGVD